MTEPILSFFYNSKDLEITILSHIDVMQAPTYSDYTRTEPLGKITYQSLTSTIDRLYVYSGNAIISFLNNTEDLIVFASNGSEDTDSGSKTYKSNRVVYNRIIEGKGKYTFLQGFVVINTFENGDRICYVYAT